MDQPVFVGVVQPTEDGKGRLVGRIMSDKRLAPLDLCPHRIVAPFQSMLLQRVVPSGLGCTDRIGELPLVLAESGLIQGTTGDTENKVVEGRPEVVRAVANEESERRVVGLGVDLKAADVMAVLDLCVLPKSIRVSTKELQGVLVERLQVSIRPINFRVDRREIGSATLLRRGHAKTPKADPGDGDRS
jgi:hypothetical protein